VHDAHWQRLTELGDLVIPVAIRVACELRIADRLAGGPLSAHALAEAAGAHPASLRRLLRMLAQKGIFAESAPGTFALTPLAELLRSDHPLSLLDAFPLLGDDVEAWGRLDHGVATGAAVFPAVHGETYWERLARRPQALARFHDAARSQARLELRLLLRAFDFSAFGTVIDVGGGSGAFLAGLVARHPAMRGIVFDRPELEEPVRRCLAGSDGRCSFAGGDFFAGLPPAGDAYLLKSVLCDWPDDAALALLGRVAAALSAPAGRLLVLEPAAGAGDLANRYDVRLLAMQGGGLRTREEMAALLGRAGFTVVRVVETPMFPLVEARLR
jgi:SAM-dependent methyltransferase